MERDKEIMSKGRVGRGEEEFGSATDTTGIVVTDRKADLEEGLDHPRIFAFVWGEKVRPAPTLPYGRWRGAA
jgi:hypothetical protein